MNPSPIEPLTAQERELAERLDLTYSADGPGPAVDARILAAAHAAAAARPSRLRSRRWPTAIGIAAALVLAVGIVWQLRPLPQHLPARDELHGAAHAARSEPPSRRAVDASSAPAPAHAAMHPAATTLVPQADAEARTDPATTPAPAPRASPAPPAPAPFPVLAERAAQPAPTKPAAKAQAAARPPAPRLPTPRPEASVPAPAPVAAVTQPQAAEAVAPVPPQVAAQQAPSAVADKLMPQPPPAAPTAAAADTRGNRTASNALTASDRPVSSDQQLPVAQWLQRIRQRVAAGDLQAARRSLHQFRQAHPEYPLPDDLRALAGEQ